MRYLLSQYRKKKSGPTDELEILKAVAINENTFYFNPFGHTFGYTMDDEDIPTFSSQTEELEFWKNKAEELKLR